MQAARWLLGICSFAVSVAAEAAPVVSASDLGGPQFTCMGAEVAGTPSGIPAFGGQWLDSWPGMLTKGFDPGPYATEKPAFTVTAQNQEQYAALLTGGQKALFKAWPQHFKMPVYPSHRDFGTPPAVCTVVKRNAATATVAKDGLSIKAEDGGIPFAIPKDGLQAIWNVLRAPRTSNETATIDIADVFKDGNIAWGKQRYQTLAATGPDAGNVAAYFLVHMLLPERDKGSIGVGFQPRNFSEGSTHVWQYNPGLRRLRQAPDIAFDYPVPPSGLRTVDDDHGFNGSPERYQWQLIGKQEMLMPYNHFKGDDPAMTYAELLTPGSPNPNLARYERHRVWVLEGTLKPGVRHVYGKRRLYIDEDTWLVLWADAYDMRGVLWRATAVNYRYVSSVPGYHRRMTVHHDLVLGAYEAGYLVNQAGENGWQINRKDLTPAMFDPNAAARKGR